MNLLFQQQQKKGKLSSVQYLIEIEKKNVETKDSYGWTPLFNASQNGHFDIIKFHVEECHVNVEVKDIRIASTEEIRAYLKSKE